MLKTEIYCHNCQSYIQFELDTTLNGNHVLKCPKCGHEHCRVVKDGQVTDDRWSSRNPTYQVATYASTTWTQMSTLTTATSSTAYWHTYTQTATTAGYYGAYTA
jgi:hypothetical protein